MPFLSNFYSVSSAVSAKIYVKVLNESLFEEKAEADMWMTFCGGCLTGTVQSTACCLYGSQGNGKSYCQQLLAFLNNRRSIEWNSEYASFSYPLIGKTHVYLSETSHGTGMRDELNQVDALMKKYTTNMGGCYMTKKNSNPVFCQDVRLGFCIDTNDAGCTQLSIFQGRRGVLLRVLLPDTTNLPNWGYLQSYADESMQTEMQYLHDYLCAFCENQLKLNGGYMGNITEKLINKTGEMLRTQKRPIHEKFLIEEIMLKKLTSNNIKDNDLYMECLDEMQSSSRNVEIDPIDDMASAVKSSKIDPENKLIIRASYFYILYKNFFSKQSQSKLSPLNQLNFAEFFMKYQSKENGTWQNKNKTSYYIIDHQVLFAYAKRLKMLTQEEIQAYEGINICEEDDSLDRILDNHEEKVDRDYDIFAIFQLKKNKNTGKFRFYQPDEKDIFDAFSPVPEQKKTAKQPKKEEKVEKQESKESYIDSSGDEIYGEEVKNITEKKKVKFLKNKSKHKNKKETEILDEQNLVNLIFKNFSKDSTKIQA
jgi:hypothetical protein